MNGRPRSLWGTMSTLVFVRSSPGVTIGNRCIIGAGSVVTKSIPDNSVAAGVPARVLKTTDEYLEQMKAKSLKCGHLRGEQKAKALKEIFHITHI